MKTTRNDPGFATDAELEIILTMWGKYDVDDIAATIRRKPRAVLKWARHVLHLLPKDNRLSPIHQPTLMRCQSCSHLQKYAAKCARCAAPRYGTVAA